MTDPKTALAGVMLEISFARFVDSMATFSEEKTPPRPFGRCDLISMTQSGGNRENTMGGGSCEQRCNATEVGGRLATVTRLAQTQPFEENCIGDRCCGTVRGNDRLADRPESLVASLTPRSKHLKCFRAAGPALCLRQCLAFGLTILDPSISRPAPTSLRYSCPAVSNLSTCPLWAVRGLEVVRYDSQDAWKGDKLPLVMGSP